MKKKLNKELVITFEYRVEADDFDSLSAISEIIEKMRESGSGEVIDMKIEQVRPEEEQRRVAKSG